MTTPRHLLAIDQGTTSTKAILINDRGEVVASSAPERFEIEPHYPEPGWVEYEPQDLWESVRGSAHAALQHAGLTWSDIAGLGLANQGETVIAFDAQDGQPIYRAISWQDRRGEPLATAWRDQGLEEEVIRLTGLKLDPYFSAPKLTWILQQIPAARELAAQNRLRLGTSDSWLLWKLTGGQSFVTDVSTASRSMLFDIDSLRWDERLCHTFGIPIDSLPTCCANAYRVGMTHRDTFGASIPITGLCVDQQAALFGQHAFNAGAAKVTYGTGCFLLANVGDDSHRRAPGLLTSVGWQLENHTRYVFDGGIYSAGSLVDWLVDLGLVSNVREIGEVVGALDEPSPVILIPAFSGLAAPHWSGRARACWLGMDQSTDRRTLIRSALEAIAFRVKEIFEQMVLNGMDLSLVRVDGGLTHCEPLMQLQADLLGVPLERNEFTEATALGVGYLAGLGSRVWRSTNEIPQMAMGTKQFKPCGKVSQRYAGAYTRWKRHCAAVIEMGNSGMFEIGDEALSNG